MDARTDRVIDRLGTGVVKRSVPVGVTLILLGLGVATIPIWITAAG